MRLGHADANAATIAQQAIQAAGETWQQLQHSSSVLWVDNMFHPQYTTQPDDNKKSQNGTALSALQQKQKNGSMLNSRIGNKQEMCLY